MQKAIIVIDTGLDETNYGKIELDTKLAQGFKVVSMCPMPSCGTGRGGDYPTCLVIIEKG